MSGEHLVVSAPTSSGKTLIGELAAMKGVLNRERALILLPLRALVNDKHQHFERVYKGFGVATIRATGEMSDDIPALMRGQYDICLLTYEKFTALVLGAPHILEQVGTVVIDEAQMITDQGRGVNVEFLLTLLRMRRKEGIEPQIIALSAVIGNTNGLERWLGGRLLRRTERPVPLDEGVLLEDGTFWFIDSADGKEKHSKYLSHVGSSGKNRDVVIPLVARLVSEGKQVIVFRETRGEARHCAEYLAAALGVAAAKDSISALPTGDPSAASQALRRTLERGVAFHISDLSRDERLVVEEHFRRPNSGIRVIAATTTLAMGINTPAEAVIVVGLTHPGKTPTPYSVAEYKNIIGRAGRLGFADRGVSFLIASSPLDPRRAWTEYVQGRPEDLKSRFIDATTDPRSLIVRVLATAPKSAMRGMAADDIVNFLEGSFAVFMKVEATGSWTWNRQQLIAALVDLERHALVAQEANRYYLTELGKIAGQSGTEVESITRIVDVLRPMSPSTISDPVLIAASQVTLELDEQYFPMNRKSKHKEPQAWRQELLKQRVPQPMLSRLDRLGVDPNGTLRAKKAAACLLWISELALSEVERILTQFGGALDGAAGPIRSLTARAQDVVPVVCQIAQLLHPTLDLGRRADRLLARLGTGAPSSVADLAQFAGTQLSRADYQALAGKRLRDIESFRKASDDQLLEFIGHDRFKLEVIRAAVARWEADLLSEAPAVSVKIVVASSHFMPSTVPRKFRAA